MLVRKWLAKELPLQSQSWKDLSMMITAHRRGWEHKAIASGGKTENKHVFHANFGLKYKWHKAAAIGWSRGCTTRSQKWREHRLPPTAVRMNHERLPRHGLYIHRQLRHEAKYCIYWINLIILSHIVLAKFSITSREIFWSLLISHANYSSSQSCDILASYLHWRIKSKQNLPCSNRYLA
jgi:hypothetical protein